MTPSGARGAAIWPRKRGICRVSAAMLLRRAQRRLVVPLSAGSLGFWFGRVFAAKCRVSAAFLGRHVRRRLLRAALLSPCWLTLLILTESAL